MKRILCYGDSNTWGFIPGSGKRYPHHIRWTGVLSEILGAEYDILVDGISGRTTVWENPLALCRNGLEGLGYGLLRAKPIDLVILMLGTNDLYHTDSFGYYRGLSMIARRILGANEFYHDSSRIFPDSPKLLLISPVALHPEIGKLRPELNLGDKYDESCRFPFYTKMLADELHVPWIDAAQFAKASDVDGLHLDPESHRKLAEAIAETVSSIL